MIAPAETVAKRRPCGTVFPMRSRPLSPVRLLPGIASASLLFMGTAPAWAEQAPAGASGTVEIEEGEEAVVVRRGEEEILRYWLRKPADSTCSSPSACYFHPLTTPSGERVTDLAPDDHLHHRGVFLAWLEVRSDRTAGDFWGWGKFAPLEDRLIANAGVENLVATAGGASFLARNEWRAAETVLLRENLRTGVHLGAEARIYDFDYTFGSDEDLTLGQFAFCGFSVRTRKDGTITAHDPDGPVSLPSPSHLKPETDWPDRPWYAFEIRLESGKALGVAVINHPDNPPTLWHNVGKIGLLNPCIVAPAPLRIEREAGLRLRYRVVCFDGGVPTDDLDRAAADFARKSGPEAAAR